ncbi:MAG: CehA/McbA family metallohydrolase [Verrucomicrobia bacterium]|nr:CehA/McbA family metallohydrolase [Verrucomicrobiota bacterium]
MTITHPYELTNTSWFRGNLHTHSTRSDGRHAPQDVLDAYAEKGYDFLMMSDHDVWTTEDDYAAFNSHGMAMIPGNEITANGPHVLHVAADRLVPADANRQTALDNINTGTGFAVIPHPNWERNFQHCPQERLEAWTGYNGIEIYNGVISRLHGSPYATDRWDRLLADGRKIWGYAHDDFHDFTKGDFALGWNVVAAATCTPASITDALKSGNFYASTGVLITDIRVKGDTITVSTQNADRIIALRDVGRRFATVDEKTITVTVPTDATYVRFECWGHGETFAWTQPFYITV